MKKHSTILLLLCGLCLVANAQTKPAALGVEEQAVAGSFYKPHDTPEMILEQKQPIL